MQAEIIYKLDFSDERAKQKAMKAVWKFSGVTFVDIKVKGRLKVRGSFDKYKMGSKLKKIDKFVDIIDPLGQAELDYKPVISSFSGRFNNVPKTQEIFVINFKVLDESILRKANTVIWEFSGVTSVEVKGVDQLEVTGEFKSLDMVLKLQKIDKYVNILKVGEYVEAPPHPTNMLGTNQSYAGSSYGPTPTPKFGATGAYARERAAAEKANQGAMDNAMQRKLPQKGGFREMNHPWDNQQPPLKLQPQVEQKLYAERDKAEKLRAEKERVEKLRAEKERAERLLRAEKERAERLRAEKERAERLRAEKERAERLRAEKERAERLRAEKERAERLRVEKENAKKLHSSKWNTEGKNTQRFTGSSSTGHPYQSTPLSSTGHPYQSTPLSSTWQSYQSTGSSGTWHPNQSSNTTPSTQHQSSKQIPRKESRSVTDKWKGNSKL